MAATDGPYGGVFSIDPTVNPAYLQLPAAQEQAPMPYSPSGWEQSKLLPIADAQKDLEKGAAMAQAQKKEDVGFTPEQAALLAKMTSVTPNPAPHAPGAVSAPRNSVGQMQQLAAPNAGGRESTPPRSSLGQIIYGGRKF